MGRRFSRIAMYAMVLSCCFVTYSCDGGQTKQTKDNEEEINTLKRQISDLQNEVYNLQNKETSTISHKYVDLGLSVKWATCNVGANKPEDCGNYYAWGETRIKSEYTSDNCTTYYESMGDIAGNSRYDVARANWGGTWRLPTKEEIEELVNGCDWKWTTRNGVNGYLVTSKKNGNSIFLPAAGNFSDTYLGSVGKWGSYWSSSPCGGISVDAFCLNFSNDMFDRWYDRRYGGQSVRPVTK